MSTKKTTNLETLEYLLKLPDLPKEHYDNIVSIKASYEKKKATSEKRSAKANEENAEYATAILAAMKKGEGYTVTELGKLTAETANFSTPKLSSIVKAMGDKVTKTVIGKKSIIKLV